jgi:tRNA nucleotidyltransferase/poly(A) polymerase
MEHTDCHINKKIFREISKVAGENNVEMWLIGGYVRDLFLKRKSKDIDIVVVGSGIKTAQILAKAIKADHISVFKNFGTAQIIKGKNEIEIVGARKESYRSDSRNPIVEDGSLEDDQNRRDFTINALAISLNPDNFGELTDPFNGIEDLKSKYSSVRGIKFRRNYGKSAALFSGFEIVRGRRVRRPVKKKKVVKKKGIRKQRVKRDELSKWLY